MNIMSTKEMKDLIIMLINMRGKNCECENELKELTETLLDLVSIKTIPEKIKYDAISKYIFTYLVAHGNCCPCISGKVNIDYKRYNYNLVLSKSDFSTELALLKSIVEKMNKKYKIDKITIINLVMLLLLKD